jgi:opacity protein-like surface antigen
MKLFAIAITSAGLLAAAGSAAAAVSDVDYLKASRCRGLAEGGLTTVDTAAMDAFIKNEGRTRNAFVTERGKSEFDKAKRETKTDNTDRKARLVAELTGPCQAYKG